MRLGERLLGAFRNARAILAFEERRARSLYSDNPFGHPKFRKAWRDYWRVYRGLERALANIDDPCRREERRTLFRRIHFTSAALRRMSLEGGFDEKD